MTRSLAGVSLREHQKTAFIQELESLRGIAAVWVVFGHCFGTLHIPDEYGFAGGVSHQTELLLRTLINSVPAVMIFFVLSGLVLTFQLSKTKNTLPNVLAYWARRVIRLMLPSAASVLLAAFLWWMRGDPKDAWVIIRNIFLISTNMNDPMWSLQVEIIASFAMPFIVWASLSLPTPVRWLVTLILLFLYLVFLPSVYLGFSILFWVGIGLAVDADKIPPAPEKFWLLILVFGLVVSVVGYFYVPGLAGVSIAVAPPIVVLFVYANRGAEILRILRSNFISWVGKISYSLYLVHFPVLEYVLWMGGSDRLLQFRYHHSFVYAFGTLLIVLPISFLLAVALHHVIERPAIKMSRRVVTGFFGRVSD